MNFVEYIKHHQYGHIPSSLSHLYYLIHIFTNKFVIPYEDNIVIGKPFGSSAYYYIWEKMGYIPSRRYCDVTKEFEIPFVDYSGETLGNSLGVSSGIELGNNKLTYVNMSDSQLQMGPTLESIQFIGRHKQNIVLTIDYNKKQLTGDLLTNLKSDMTMFNLNGWKSYSIDNPSDINKSMFSHNHPVVIFVNTIKGKGIKEMENDPVYWHYKPIEDEQLTVDKELLSL